MRDRAVDFDHQIALPAIEDVAEVLELFLVHVQLAALGDIRLYVAGTCQEASGLQGVAVVGFRRTLRGTRAGRDQNRV